MPNPCFTCTIDTTESRASLQCHWLCRFPSNMQHRVGSVSSWLLRAAHVFVICAAAHAAGQLAEIDAQTLLHLHNTHNRSSRSGTQCCWLCRFAVGVQRSVCSMSSRLLRAARVSYLLP